eukprot:CAMPEP_0113876178 /NCGR_PEP_ID=MMETSP0780_2-20120614/5345_1 /TAXON_ID=652834 /ORGANISM="Palpitomonas bilix" /LENGTH=431 /DNA_ID=CAMNT_0000862233 /DNA_START=68 /DNA_END=1363 /DNA_ORIENTATION=- /assembly_acc=CAM_ASM_000599
MMWMGAITVLIAIEAVAVFKLIIPRVPYTEIDWEAYMSQIRGYLSGERNYTHLEGATGPLVYPAGFVYVYAALYRLAEDGTNIEMAQLAFGVLYLLLIYFVLRVYQRSALIPLSVAIFACLSRRLHSIFVLRLFNDGIAMIVVFAALLMYSKRRWIVGSVMYTFALSIKMNILLFLPGIAITLVQAKGWAAVVDAIVMVVIQLALGWPFLEYDAHSYFNRAFNFGRQFEHKWTVNWKYLTLEAFADRRLHLALLVLHVACLLAFFIRAGRIQKCLRILFLGAEKVKTVSASEVITSALVSNMIGIVFCRSLHFQFYSWYFHCLPFIVWVFGGRFFRRFLSEAAASVAAFTTVAVVFAVVEYVYNVYPATPLTSSLLTAAHLFVLALMLSGSRHVYTVFDYLDGVEQEKGEEKSEERGGGVDGKGEAKAKVE